METDEALLAQLQERDEWIEYLQRRNDEFQSLIEELEWADHQQLSSPAWKLATRLDNALRRIAPPASRRRRMLHFGYRAMRALPKLGRREFRAKKARALWARVRDVLGVASGRLPIGNPELLRPPVEVNLAAVDLLSFPRFDRVDVSIVIPVYNHVRDTVACLESIKGSRPDATYEVIVVDDGSSDGTQKILSRIEGLVTIRNPRNEGFIGSCNRGAAAARGEHIVFLNNDTTVTEGWLDALVATFRNMPGTGLAGAKLIYPNGRLQEAGGVIWRDASGWNYGRGDDPDHPRYNFTREVDYCSGACIMVPRDLFHELGGFDRSYSPAYYEDTDLAFKIRHAGHKVIYQPMARIIHHEGLTSG
ncbi:MAG TPA: glycosyltransferase family 2 protein, partial [Isosphaeraceae bacterium]|nr:glycosyltransferase family 2 protein [Isosphaeraceae bacterium]